MSNPSTTNTPNLFWRFFRSVKLTIVLLILLATVSILGTLIPQQEQAVDFARGLSPGTFRLFSGLGLFDMYHAAWFRIILGCLAVNLIICSLDRFPGTWKRFRSWPRPDRRKPFDGLAENRDFVVPTPLKETAGHVGSILNRRYRSLRQKASEDDQHFYGDKGRYAYFGVYLVHASVLLILVGGLVGSFFGFEAYVNIVEGSKVDSVRLRNQMTPLKLGFQIRCDKFTVESYPNGTPKEYRSDLTFFVGGKPVQKGSLRVNHPIRFRGVTIYQSSFGKVPGRQVQLGISRKSSKDETLSQTVTLGTPVSLPGKDGSLTVADIRSDIMNLGPAVLVSIKSTAGQEKRFWVFQDPEKALKQLPAPMRRSPRFDASAFRPYTVFLKAVATAYYTGVQVNKDPGVSIVWIGCFLMVGGFILTFFTSHRRIWVRVSRAADGSRICVAGTASKNPVGLERELNHLAEGIRERLGKKG
jgi:cytochrome c biogenesis protein